MLLFQLWNRIKLLDNFQGILFKLLLNNLKMINISLWKL
jgi:hypothetical protein